MSIATVTSLKESEARVADAKSRRLQFGYFAHIFNGQTINLYLAHAPDHYKEPQLILPIPQVQIWVDPHTSIDKLAKCAGLQTYDTALPLGWIRQEYTDHGLDFPKGVWVYRDHLGEWCNFGKFVDLGDLLMIIADLLVGDGLIALGIPIDPTVKPDAPLPPIKLGIGDRVYVEWNELSDPHTRACIVEKINASGIWVRLEFFGDAQLYRIEYAGDADKYIWRIWK